jgi:hypothetical protein
LSVRQRFFFSLSNDLSVSTWKAQGYNKTGDSLIDLANILVDWVWGSGKYGIMIPLLSFIYSFLHKKRQMEGELLKLKYYAEKHTYFICHFCLFSDICAGISLLNKNK